MRLREVSVHGRFARWMRRRHWSGVCLPLPWVTVILYWLTDEEVEPHAVYRTHERAHARQAFTLGWWRWWLRYAWGMRKGYRANPLEVDARKAAGQE